MKARTLVLVGAVLAVVSLGLPWRSIPASGTFVPGLPGGSYPGTDSVARFFIAATVALALIGGLYLGRSRALRWSAYVGLAGVALYLTYGLTGGALALFAAAACLWLAARRTTDDVAAGG